MIGKFGDVTATMGFAAFLLSAPWVVLGLVPPSDRPTMNGELGKLCRRYRRRWVTALCIGIGLIALGSVLRVVA